ncbi:DTW domain-containing protein [Phycomyces blakesleeanus]|uniref:tRNA-uridine aminocarboxypropyltransferase 1 n=2 Tax=Phycomyces blakesleeanus TaxID=4837 RepID=A0A167QVZ6_PHYB8|nr:hypothetical protein PHYBLDRAFT_137918 [Phycomyces blakesleeanus NRRL 1555(-)]OAD80360.1 hypothetical protein PHYBLDRAFT_137918 [Phycomyces blakesleeanus NRRL 1555(-)]|eukprot:XP_018298400.1 hypothetical protein PHYBLDRAFT_137918 [Phycomyces blakesleeanus NRRL 1555(-)]
MANISTDSNSEQPCKKTSPFADLKTSDDTILYATSDRQKCPTCSRMLKYFCYRCFTVIGMDRSQVPSITLPVPLDVIKHEQELDGKSTAIHARVLAENDVAIYNWQEIPTYENPERVLMLFPGPDAKTLDQIPRESFDRIIVIDGTWRQAKRMVRETPQLGLMQKVTIEPRQTYFWRYQQLSENYLATIEAIYYLYREFAETYETPDGYDGRYDNLMFYYRFFYELIQDYYKEKTQKKFTHRHKRDYIQYESNEKEASEPK